MLVSSFVAPGGICLVAASATAATASDIVTGYIYPSTPDFNIVSRFDDSTGAPQASGGVTYTTGGLAGASGVAFGPDGNLYVSSNLGTAGGGGNVLEFNGTTDAYIGVYATLPDFSAAPAD